MIAQVYEKHPAAEQFEADLKLLSHARREERIRGCGRVVEAGSAAVLPLLKVAVYDKYSDVRDAAMWEVVRVADDLQGVTETDAAAITEHLDEASRSLDPFVRLGAASALARQVGASVASVAAARLGNLDEGTREAALSLLERLVREEPDRDADLETSLKAATGNRYVAVRERAEELLTLLAEVRSVHVGTTGPNALLGGNLRARRFAARAIVPDEESAQRLMLSSLADPDRTVRHLANIKLFDYLRGGTTLALMETVALPIGETSALFLEVEGALKWNPATLSFFSHTLDSGTVVAKQRVLMLLSRLRPVMSPEEAAKIDSLVLRGMRDEDREVRRYATAAAKHFSSGEGLNVLQGRLRQHWRFPSHRQRIASIAIAGSVAAALAATGHGEWMFCALMSSDLLLRILFTVGKEKNAPPVTEDEIYETLCALDPVAEARPEELRGSVRQLRALASPLGSVSPEIRTKARELLAKVNEATLHELPIAATAPALEPESLPIPGAAPEPREVVAR